MQEVTKYRNTPAGIVATRGKRELHVLATSFNEVKTARRLLAEESFDSLFKRAKRAPGMRGVAFIKISEL